MAIYYGQHVNRSNCQVFNDAILSEVESMAKQGLTREEIISGYSLEWDALPAEDQEAFMEHFNYGKIQGIKQMSEALFMQAKSKNGTAAALAYLLRFAQNFPQIGDGNATITIRDETGQSIIPDTNVKIT
jgi:hypothetical protein